MSEGKDKKGSGPRGRKQGGAPSSKRNHRKGPASGRPSGKRERPSGGRPAHGKPSKKQEGIRLNKYIANSGKCSRREADDMISAGAVKINNKVVTELGTRVLPGDTVHLGDELLRGEKPVYLLLNKPKDYLTTTEDPQGRKTVMMLIAKACKERVYPVGRLDRNTTGLLLFTNDGELAKKLTHPKSNIKKIYEVYLNKSVSGNDLEQLKNGVQLEDGPVKADSVSFVGGDKRTVGLEIHSGKNRVVRRLFEHLGYEVVKLDRVMFAGLTKKDLSRGRWRFLTQQELSNLHML